MHDFTRTLPGILAAATSVVVHWAIWNQLRKRNIFASTRLRRSLWLLAPLLLSAWIIWSVLVDTRVIFLWPRPQWVPLATGAALTWAFSLVAAYGIWKLWSPVTDIDPRRRTLLMAAGGALAASPFAAVAYGVLVERSDFRVRELDVPIPGLPQDLQGLRLVQLSDIHLGAFLEEKELARVVDMANELRGHIALVTGDLISSLGDPLDVALRQVARLRADAGIWGCHGNHEIYSFAEEYATREGLRLGIRFLRREAQMLRFGNHRINLAGVDYQRTRRPYMVGAERLVRPGALNILLSHNPDVFPVAAAQGFDLTISGHTHGGQVNVEILDHSLSVSRFFTPYTYGLYGRGPRSIYVTRGIGTVGIPVRIGAPPEVTLLRLCAT